MFWLEAKLEFKIKFPDLLNLKVFMKICMLFIDDLFKDEHLKKSIHTLQFFYSLHNCKTFVLYG